MVMWAQKKTKARRETGRPRGRGHPHSVDWRGLTEQVTFEHIERGGGRATWTSRGRVFQAEGIASAKALR